MTTIQHFQEIMTNGAGTTFNELEKLINVAKPIENPIIQTWIHQSEHLFSNPQTFDYNPEQH